MKENFIHFLSNDMCLLSINGNNIGLIDNLNTFELDIITNTNNVFVTYNPILSNKNFVPYTFKLETSNKPKTENDNIKIIPYPDNNYDILMTPFYYYNPSPTKIILNENIDKYFISITNDTNSKINIFSGNTTVFNLNTEKLINAKAEFKNDLFIIEGIISENEIYYLLIIDTMNFSIIYNSKCQSIEYTNEFIQAYKKLNNITHNAEVFKLSFNDKQVEKFYVYEDENINQPTNNVLIPLAFIENIKINNEKTAKFFLSNNFQNTSLDDFKGFFGNIKNIYINRHIKKQNIINYTIESEKFKNYNFILENNKIIDIEEISI